MFGQHLSKIPVKSISPTLLCETPPTEWGLAETDKVIDAFYVLKRKILSIRDKNYKHHLKIVTDGKVQSLSFPFYSPCKRIIIHSDNYLLCVASDSNEDSQFKNDFGFALLDLNQNKFISTVDIKNAFCAQVIGFLKHSEDEDILVIHKQIYKEKSSSKEKKTDVPKRIIDSFSRGETRGEIRSCTATLETEPLLEFFKLAKRPTKARFNFFSSVFKSFNTVKTEFTNVQIDCEGTHLICNNNLRFRVDKEGQLERTSFFDLIRSHFPYNRVNTALVGEGYIWSQDEKTQHIKIMNKNFGEIVSCRLPDEIASKIKTIHALADGKTFVVEFRHAKSLGIFKLSDSDKVDMQLHELPKVLKKIVINENEAQLICFERGDYVTGGKVSVINNFAPLLDFVAIDKKLEESVTQFPRPLRGMVTAYLGNPSIKY
ncbi:MAG: hypothetical protein ACYCQI_06580 [Gammaproteobacteria bacterium]